MSTPIQEYIDKHALQKKVEDVLNACVSAKPADPLAFMVSPKQKGVESEAGPSKVDACAFFSGSLSILPSSIDRAHCRRNLKMREVLWSTDRRSEERRGEEREGGERGEGREGAEHTAHTLSLSLSSLPLLLRRLSLLTLAYCRDGSEA